MTAAARRVLVLGSGEGTNFEAIAAAASPEWYVVAVGSDRADAPILARARRRGIAAFCNAPGDFPDAAAHDQALARAAAAHRPDLIALAGYMRILGPAMLAAWEGRMLNIHPSLLPAFPGLHTHQRVLAAGDRFHGATVHFVTPELDAGPRIVQGRLQVHETDSADTLCRRVQALEHRIYPLAIGWYAAGRLRMVDGRTRLDERVLDEPVVIEEGECD